MKIIFEEEIAQYCLNSADERTTAIDELDTADARPVRVLPIFEICRALHFGAINGAIRPNAFRTCWSSLVDELFSRADRGYLVHVAVGESQVGRMVTEILAIGQVEIEQEDLKGRDPRVRRNDHRALTERFRRLHKLALAELESIDESYRGWECQPPDYLPDIQFSPRTEEEKDEEDLVADLVLDTNNLIDLLNALPLDGQWTGKLRLPDRLSERASRWFRTILSRAGLAGKLIVPISALEEAERVINYRRNRTKYKQARLVLNEIGYNPVWPLRNAFYFQPLSHEMLSAFVALHEQLVAHKATQWPDFGDALVLAHGLANRCPVASNEWFEKADWAAVEAIFDYLVLKDDG